MPVDRAAAYEGAIQSPLMALPKKVKVKIYAYAVTYSEPIPIRLHTTTTDVPGSGAVILKQSKFFNPPLLRTCRKIKKDAARLFYANNSFQAELTDGDTSTLMTWLMSTDPPYLALVPELVITLNPRSYFDVVQLRQSAQDGSTNKRTYDLATTLVTKGITVDRIMMTRPADTKHLSEDAYLLEGRVEDTAQLSEEWFDELQKCLDDEEYGIDGFEYDGEADNDELCLVMEKMGSLLQPAEGRQ